MNTQTQTHEISNGYPATTTVAPVRPRTIKVARAYYAVVATIGTTAVVAALAIGASRGGAEGMVGLLSEMTYWSNILVAVIGWSLVINPQRDGRFFRWLRFSSLVMISVVGLVYPLILAANADPTGYEVYTNIAVHYIMPWATLLGWLVFGPRPRITLGTVALMPILPVLYTTYAMAYGAVLNPTGGYPYPFLDPATGTSQVAVHIAMIMVIGLAFGFLYWGIDRALSKGVTPTKLSGEAIPQQIDAARVADETLAPDRVVEKV